MSTFRATMKTSAMRGRIRAIRAEIVRRLNAEARVIAERAIEGYYEGTAEIARSGYAGGRGRLYGRVKLLRSVFVPVQLKHRRREQWPDLWPIYQARIVRGQRTYQGRSIFWVDEVKLRALEQRIVSSSLRGLHPGQWEIEVETGEAVIRIVLRKKGRRERGDGAKVKRAIKAIERVFAAEAARILYEALRG